MIFVTFLGISQLGARSWSIKKKKKTTGKVNSAQSSSSKVKLVQVGRDWKRFVSGPGWGRTPANKVSGRVNSALLAAAAENKWSGLAAN